MAYKPWVDATPIARWTYIQAALDRREVSPYDPTQPEHPILNPSPEDQARQTEAFKASVDKAKKEKRSPTQEQYWRQAIELIKTGQVKSYADLGLRFRYTSSQRWGEPFTEHWARLLVKKMIVRKVFTEEEIAVLIPDQTKHSNKKESK